VSSNANFVGERPKAICIVKCTPQRSFETAFRNLWEFGINPLCCNQETIEKIKLVSFRESASIFLVFPRLGERVFKGKVVTKMGRNKKRILLLTLLKREHSLIYRGTDQTTYPIACRLVIALCPVSTDSHCYEPIPGRSGRL
jgi:hypothetical protein